MKILFKSLHIQPIFIMGIFKKSFLLVGFLMLFIFASLFEMKAQQDHINGFYMFNPLAFNPAIAGVNDELVLSGIVREQWVGLPGAPNTQYANAHMPVFSWYDRYDRPGNIAYPTGISTGIMMLNDKIASTENIEGMRLARVSVPVSMRVRLTRSGIRLSLGLRVDGSRLSQNYDGALANDSEILSFPTVYYMDFSSGLYVYHTKWYAGISITNMRNKSFVNEKYKFASHYFASAGYAQPINEDLVLRLTTLGTLVTGTPLSVTVTPAVIIKDNIETGLSYRTEGMVGAFFAFEPIHSLKVGYLYEYALGFKQSRVGATHEIMVQFTLDSNKKRIISPRYFW